MSYDDATNRWVEAGLIDGDTASAIVSFEEEQRSQPSGVPGSLEALAYVGAVFILSATMLFLLAEWGSWSKPMQLSASATGTLVAVVSGWFVGAMEGAVAARVRSLVWAVAVGFFGVTAGLTIDIAIDASSEVSFVLAAVAALLFATVLWQRSPSSLQMVALFIAAAVTVIAIVDLARGTPTWVTTGSIAVLGAGWLMATDRSLLHPRRTSTVMAAIGMLAVGLPWNGGAWTLIAGTGIAAALLFLGTRRGQTVLVGFGIAGLLWYLPATMLDLFGDTLGVPLSMLVTGAVVLTIAVNYGRRGSKAEPRVRARSDTDEASLHE